MLPIQQSHSITDTAISLQETFVFNRGTTRAVPCHPALSFRGNEQMTVFFTHARLNFIRPITLSQSDSQKCFPSK